METSGPGDRARMCWAQWRADDFTVKSAGHRRISWTRFLGTELQPELELASLIWIEPIAIVAEIYVDWRRVSHEV